MVQQAVNLDLLAMIRAAEGSDVGAATLWAQADALHRRTGVGVEARDREDLDDAVAGCRRRLGEERFAAVWAAGEGQDHGTAPAGGRAGSV